MQQLLLIPEDLLKSLIEDAVRRGLSEIPPYPSQAVSKSKIMSREDAATYLGVRPNTLTKYHRQGKVSAAVISGQYRFFESDLLKFLDKTKNKI